MGNKIIMPENKDGGYLISEDYKKELKELKNSIEYNTFTKEQKEFIEELINSPTYDWWNNHE